MKLVEVNQLFRVKYGINLDLNKLIQTEINEGIRYVGRTEKNNGVTSWVKPESHKEPNPPMTISVAGGGSVLSTFVQEHPYYSGRDLFYLEPIEEMNLNELLYYATVIRKNKFKFSYGRQANRTLHSLMIPTRDNIPEEIRTYNIDESYYVDLFSKCYKTVAQSASVIADNELDNSVGNLFTVVNGINASNYVIQPDRPNPDLIPMIRPSKWQSTSYAGYVSKEEVPHDKIFPAGTLYVGTNGAGSHTYAYVSIETFTFNSDVSVLIPKKEMSLDEKLVYATLITANRFKFSYGRKPKGDRLKNIILPCNT